MSRDLLASLDRVVFRLGEAVDAPATDLNRDASIQRFEFCFELAWKAMQRALHSLVDVLRETTDDPSDAE